MPFPDGEDIISTTDLKGIVTSFNETFQTISGFDFDELFNKNHNLILTFRQWHLMICWVDAYISPVIENGSVVDEEVRSLASKTQASTQQIQSLIQNLNNAVAHTVKVMQQSQQTSEQQVSVAIQALQTIAEQVSSMNDLNTQIATAVEEQSAISEDINRSIVRANDNANQAMSGVEVANKAAKDLQGQSHHLTNMIGRFQQDS